MRSGALADAAWKDLGGEGEDEGKGAFGGDSADDAPNPELVAQMEKFLAAAGRKDAEAMARAFEGATQACGGE